LIKLLRVTLASLFKGAVGAADVGGKGTKNPSFSIVSSLSMQFSDWKSSVKILSVVGVRTDEEFVVAKEFVEAVSHAPTNNPRLTFCVF